MIRLPARLVLATSAALVLAGSGAAPLIAPASAQENPNTFTLPTATPTPTPAPAGPADERAGVAIPPRAVPVARPTATPTATPTAAPTAATPRITLPAPVRTAPASAPSAVRTGAAPAPAATGPTTLSPAPTASADPLTLPTAAPLALPTLSAPVAALEAETHTDTILALPVWQLAAGGGLAAAVLLGGGLLLWSRRRKPKVLRLAAAPAMADEAGAVTDLAYLHLTLDVTTATRSLMMFSLGYRLNIANRSGRAVNDLRVAVQMVCARASAGAPSVGAAQALGEVARIGPHQARSTTGEVRLALSAIQPLRQGMTPLFVPLVHVTLEGEGQPALTKTFVIGSPSASGRVHPIPLDQPPGGIAGLVAQAVTLPSVPAAA